MDSCAIAHSLWMVYIAFGALGTATTDPATTLEYGLRRPKCLPTGLFASITYIESSKHKYAGVVIRWCSSLIGMRLEGTGGEYGAGFHPQRTALTPGSERVE